MSCNCLSLQVDAHKYRFRLQPTTTNPINRTFFFFFLDVNECAHLQMHSEVSLSAGGVTVFHSDRVWAAACLLHEMSFNIARCECCTGAISAKI